MAQFTTHIVGAGDTIQMIGNKYNVDWTEIVNLNGLEYPYVSADNVETEYSNIDTVAKIGSKLIIPTDGLNVPYRTNTSSSEVELYAFGGDLDLFTAEAGENYNVVNLEIAGQLTDDAGDLKLATGIDNLKQQLIIRLGTEKGALLLHPEFGSDIIKTIGAKVTPELLTQVKLEVAECLTGDFRVKSVNNIAVAYSSGKIHVDCDVTPIAPYSTFTLSHTYIK